MKNMEIKNHITLTGPASVGKSFIASELSKKTGLPVVSLDELVMMIREEMNGELSLSNEISLKKFKMRYLMYAGYNELSSSMQKELEKSIDAYVEKYKFYCETLGGLEKFYKILQEYDSVCAEIKKPSTEFAVAFTQRLNLKLMESILKNIKFPVILDTPAPAGIEPKFKNDDGKYIDFIESEGFVIPTKELQGKFFEIMEQAGTIVFLQPGGDYKHRCGANDEFNELLLKHLENYESKAHKIIVVDNLFENPNDPALKSRQRFDVHSFEKIDAIKNHESITLVCEAIVTAAQKHPQSFGE